MIRKLAKSFYCIEDKIIENFTMADIHSRILDVRPPGPICFHFHRSTVFSKVWPNNRSVSLFGLAPLLGNPESITALYRGQGRRGMVDVS